jgi:hypothetical protein
MDNCQDPPKHKKGCNCGWCFDLKAQQIWLKAHPHSKPEKDGQLPEVEEERMD